MAHLESGWRQLEIGPPWGLPIRRSPAHTRQISCITGDERISTIVDHHHNHAAVTLNRLNIYNITDDGGHFSRRLNSCTNWILICCVPSSVVNSSVQWGSWFAQSMETSNIEVKLTAIILTDSGRLQHIWSRLLNTKLLNGLHRYKATEGKP